MNAKIRIRNRNYIVRTYTIGQHFGTAARVRIGSRTFESRACPLGFARAAIDDVVARVVAVYPEAREA